MDLFDLGWNAFFALHFDPHAQDGLRPARVIRQDRHRYLVRDEAGVFAAQPLGRMQQAEPDSSQWPTVGDWVGIAVFDGGQAVIHTVLPRYSAFSRKEAGTSTRAQTLAANIDTAFLVSGLDDDFNLRRIERYLVQAAGSGARPVVLLNKADVCADAEARIAEAARLAPGVAVLAMSARTGSGQDALRPYLQPGQTVSFLGSSGVGKSSIVNRLLGEEHLATQAVRSGDGRGRHTTTYRELLLLPGGGMVIDTPGLRELQLWGDEADLQAAFTDIDALAAGCRFRDCTHAVEPGCAVQEALASGRLEEARYRSYLKLRRELAHLNRRQDAARYQERQRTKQFGRLRTRINRHNPKRLRG